jgi:Concanavalin A-like lectin/glucanases superfamily
MQLKPSRWNVAPALIAPQARGLWRGLAFVAPLWGHSGKGALLGPAGAPLAGANLVAGSTIVWRGTPYGLGVGRSGASNVLDQADFAPVVTSDGAWTGDFTTAILANPVAEAVAATLMMQAVSGADPRFYIQANSANLSGNLRVGLTGDVVSVSGGNDGKYHLFAGRRAGASLTAWIDGVLRATNASAPGAIGSAAAGLAFGSNAESTAGRIHFDTSIVMAAAWNRALSDAEMRMLACDPFCMLRPAIEWRGVWTLLGYTITQPVAWRILSRTAKTSAWRIAARSAKAAAWSIFARAGKTTAWRVFTRASKSAAWRVFSRAAKATAWSILNTLQASKAVAWRVMGRVQKPSAWRIFTRASKPSSWRVMGRRAAAAAWRVFTRLAKPSAWRIGPEPSVAADVHLFARPHARHIRSRARPRHMTATRRTRSILAKQRTG